MAYGVKVQLVVDSTTAAKNKFRASVQKLATKLTSSDPIVLKKVKLDLGSIEFANKRQLVDHLNEQLSGENLSLKINKIDAKPAIEQFRKDLVKMLSGLTITGVKEFVESAPGGDGAKEAIEYAKRSVAANWTRHRMMSYSRSIKG